MATPPPHCSVCTKFHNQKRCPEGEYLRVMFKHIDGTLYSLPRWICNWCKRAMFDNEMGKWKAK